jgi:hypothetical protein
MRAFRVFGWEAKLLLVMALLTLVGCSAGDGLVEVGGTVTFDGAPIQDGRIQFRSTEGDQQAYAGLIENGKYVIRVAPGPALVEVRASRLIPGKFVEANPGEKDPVGEMYIPEKYNSRTELRATVETAKLEQNFDLVSK